MSSIGCRIGKQTFEKHKAMGEMRRNQKSARDDRASD
jgi:hypothetical protein